MYDGQSDKASVGCVEYVYEYDIAPLQTKQP